MTREARLVLVVSLWVRPENVAEFEAFERRAGAIMAHHGGHIERVVRIERRAPPADEPFEIHLVSFPHAEAFAAYREDAEMRMPASVRERVIERTTLLSGGDVTPY